MVSRQAPGARWRNERGFSLVELMIVAAITAAVMGAAVTLANGVQTTYSYQLNDAGVQQEARYVLDWIGRVLAAAGSNPYEITISACPVAATSFSAIRLDPDGDGVHDDIRVQADINPPNGILIGETGACLQQQGGDPGEDVTIAHDAENSTITRFDRALETSPVPVTDTVFTELLFTYLTASRTATSDSDATAYVQVSLTGQSRSRNPFTGEFSRFEYDSEIRLRVR